MDETLVYLMRVYGWPLEYTRNLIRTLPITQLNALIAETERQEAIKQYNHNYLMAVLCSVMSGQEIDTFIRKPEGEKHGTAKGTKTPDDNPEGSHFYTVPAQPERA
jgi:hypothetical protein